MRLRRVTPLLWIAAFLGGGCALSIGFTGWNSSDTDSAKSASHESSGGVVTEGAVAAVQQAAKPAPTAAPGVSSQAGGQVALSADDSALVAEICELQMMAHGTDLELASRQWLALADVTSRIQTIRQTFEAGIATATLIAPGHVHVEIPGYASAGTALRTKFYSQLGDELGDGVAAEVIEKLGPRLEGYFGAFGVSLQSLEIETSPQSGSDVEVTRTVTFWNRENGSDQLATRHETHLPAMEDPTGERWGALLALAKT